MFDGVKVKKKSALQKYGVEMLHFSFMQLKQVHYHLCSGFIQYKDVLVSPKMLECS